MGRSLGKLTALFVARAKRPGFYSDGGNLYLQVESATAKSWIFRYAGRYMGLGSAVIVGLQEARDLAHEYRKLRREGIDPIETKRAAITASPRCGQSHHIQTMRRSVYQNASGRLARREAHSAMGQYHCDIC